jgi:hypothetical protein
MLLKVHPFPVPIVQIIPGSGDSNRRFDKNLSRQKPVAESAPGMATMTAAGLWRGVLSRGGDEDRRGSEGDDVR